MVIVALPSFWHVGNAKLLAWPRFIRRKFTAAQACCIGPAVWCSTFCLGHRALTTCAGCGLSRYWPACMRRSREERPTTSCEWACAAVGRALPAGALQIRLAAWRRMVVLLVLGRGRPSESDRRRSGCCRSIGSRAGSRLEPMRLGLQPQRQRSCSEVAGSAPVRRAAGAATELSSVGLGARHTTLAPLQRGAGEAVGAGLCKRRKGFEALSACAHRRMMGLGQSLQSSEGFS